MAFPHGAIGPARRDGRMAAMAIRLYDLAGADDRRFSPYCWRVKLALAHKGLGFETVPWRFTEKDAIAFSGQELVPVLLDGDKTVADSWRIALHLDAAYPDRPRLMDSEQARAVILAFKFWCERVIHVILLRAIVLDLFSKVHEKDKAYFRQTREKRFGKTLEEFGSDPAAAIASLRSTLEPVRLALADQPYLGGSSPSFADYILFGAFQWARLVSPKRLLEADDPVYAWRERLLDAHGAMARKAGGYPV